MEVGWDVVMLRAWKRVVRVWVLPVAQAVRIRNCASAGDGDDGMVDSVLGKWCWSDLGLSGFFVFTVRRGRGKSRGNVLYT